MLHSLFVVGTVMDCLFRRYLTKELI